MTIFRPLLTLLLCIFAALLSACVAGPSEKGESVSAETYYIDAGLDFAIEYPADWGRVREQTTPTVRWFPRTKKGQEADVMIAVTSLPPSEVPGGSERMLADFAAAHPGFVLTGKEHSTFSGEMVALKVLGHTPSRTIQVLFFTSSQRAFVLEISTPPEHFDQYRPIFEEMAGTFESLD